MCYVMLNGLRVARPDFTQPRVPVPWTRRTLYRTHTRARPSRARAVPCTCVCCVQRAPFCPIVVVAAATHTPSLDATLSSLQCAGGGARHGA